MPDIEQFYFSILDFLTAYGWESLLVRVKVFSAALSFLFFIWWAYSLWKASTITASPPALPSSPHDLPKPLDKLQWISIIDRISSDDADDWRLAVIEADTVVDDALRKKGFDGSDLGERLKLVKPPDLESLPLLIRAHETARRLSEDPRQILTKDEAREILGYYEAALKELERKR